jgi:hypothetical protein
MERIEMRGDKPLEGTVRPAGERRARASHARPATSEKHSPRLLASTADGQLRLWIAVSAALVVLFICAPSAFAAPVWNVESEALPTSFQSSDTTSSVQDLVVNATGGTYTLSFAGQTTTPLAFNASDAEVASALDALSTIGGAGGTVTVTEPEVAGSLAADRFLAVTFGGALKAQDVPVMTADSALLTGEAHTAGIAPATNDAYEIIVENVGEASSSGPITMTDHLPPGVTTTTPPEETTSHGVNRQWSCSEGVGQSVVTCTATDAIAPLTVGYNETSPEGGPGFLDSLVIPVTVSRGTPPEQGTNSVTVSGGGGAMVTAASNANPINTVTTTRFGTAFLNFDAIGPNGEAFAQAGGHPYAVTTEFQFKKEATPGVTNAPFVGLNEGYVNVATGEEAKTIVAELPLGLIGDPQATPRCSQLQFAESSGNNSSACPADSRVGVLTVQKPGPGPYQLFNISPVPGHAAQFGFHVDGVGIVLYGDVVHSARGYLLRVTTLAPQAYIRAVSLTFFGDPAAVFATSQKDTPFLSEPSDCGASEEARTLQLHIDTWTHPGAGDPFNADFGDPNWAPASAALPPVEGCGALRFDPSLSLAPSSGAEGGTTQADEPSGYTVNLNVPQIEAVSELSTPELKTATVTLPEGLSVSPSAANGLEACSDAQIALESNEPGSCPPAAQIGTVKVTTPLLEDPLEGQVFLGEPGCSPCSEADAAEGHIFRLFIQIHSARYGITIKLPGVARANPQTGQLTAEFAENPQLPFSDLELHFNSGPRAPLANPQTCGTFTTSADLTAWSSPETPDAISQSSFSTGGCAAGFSPGFTAGTASAAAGAYSPFSVTFSRGDREQDLGGISVSTPAGLLGQVAGVAQCPEAQANAGSCGPESQLGTTSVVVGPGPDPYTITGGRVYLTGPYEGDPFGLSIVVPAVAGPFNLGDVVVRARIAVNPTTAALTITSDPLPQIKDGVPFRLRSVTVEVNRPDFMFNATNCSEQAIAATITGEHPIASSEASKTSVASSAYAASGCANLPFKPKLTAMVAGRASKADGASLDVKLESAGLGQANIAKVDLQLPTQLPSRLSTLQKACPEAVFDTNPAGCPEGSVIGNATIHTPLLNAALSGPAYLVSHGGAAFPDVEFVLQGEGVVLVLDGKTDIKKGITYSNFEATPDAPFTSFETELPTGPHSILTADVPASADYSLCGTTLTMPTKITGQNGRILTQTTKIAETGCKATKPLTRAQELTSALKQCKKTKKNKKQRAACEKQARKKYGAKKAKKKKSTPSKGSK